MSITPSPEQAAIFQHIKDTNDHLIIDAKAGTGKTSTLLTALPLLRGSVSAQAFNKSAAVDMQQRAQLSVIDAVRISISTVHSYGLSCFRAAGMRPVTTSGKVYYLARDKLKRDFNERDDIHKNLSVIIGLVSKAKAAGFGISSTGEAFPVVSDDSDWQLLCDHYDIDTDITGETSLDTIIGVSRAVLLESNSKPLSIDFDDMIYLPLLHNLKMKTFDNVLLDEAQDINATRRELAFRALSPKGRLIAVGDPNQAIYGFTGASVDSLQRIADRSGAVTLPLSVCWRCDGDIIKATQKEVPGIYARPGAASGTVTTLNDPVEMLDTAKPGSAVICRLNKPLVAACLGFLRRNIPAKIEGRNLGKKLISHFKKATDLYAIQPLAASIADIETYAEEQEAILMLKNKQAASALLADELDALILIINRTIEDKSSATFPDLEAKITSLFGDDIQPKNTITLSSVHKSKGREWPEVYILGFADYMPFHRAIMPWEIEQEYNLIYVAKTRAEHELYYVNGVESAIAKGTFR